MVHPAKSFKIAAVLSAIALANFLASSVHAQGYIDRQQGPQSEAPLLDGARCVHQSTRSNSDRLQTRSADVAVNRHFYTSDFHITIRAGYTAVLACQADSIIYPIVLFQLGVPDEDARNNTLATVNVYQGSNVEQSYSNVVPGSVINSTVALANSDNFSVEVICHRAGPHYNNMASFCNLHFLEAKLYTAQGFNQSSSSGSSSNQPTLSTGSQPTLRTGSSEPVQSSGSHTSPNGNTGNVVTDTVDTIESTVDVIERLGDIFGF